MGGEEQFWKDIEYNSQQCCDNKVIKIEYIKACFERYKQYIRESIKEARNNWMIEKDNNWWDEFEEDIGLR